MGLLLQLTRSRRTTMDFLLTFQVAAARGAAGSGLMRLHQLGSLLMDRERR